MHNIKKVPFSGKFSKLSKSWSTEAWDAALNSSKLEAAISSFLISPLFFWNSGVYFHKTDILIVGNNSLLNSMLSIIALRKGLSVSILMTSEFDSNIGMYRASNDYASLVLVEKALFGNNESLSADGNKNSAKDFHKYVSRKLFDALNISSGTLTFISAEGRGLFNHKRASGDDYYSLRTCCDDVATPLKKIDPFKIYSKSKSLTRKISFPFISQKQSWNPNPENSFISADKIIVADVFYDGFIDNGCHMFPFADKEGGFEYEGDAFMKSFFSGSLRAKEYINK